MSPTEAMLTRINDLSGSGGGGGGGGSTGITSTGSGSGSGTGSGVVAQAASNASAADTNSVRELVTETDTEDVNLRNTQATTQHIQFVEILRRSDIHAVVVPVVDLHALNM